MGPHAGFRSKLMRGIHAEAAKRKIDHDGLREILQSRTGAKSIADVPDDELYNLYRSWTGNGIRHCRHRGAIEKHQLVSAADLEMLAQEFAKRGMDEAAQASFIARQLRGKRTIQTRGQYFSVLNGVRAMNRREGLTPSWKTN